MGRGQWSWRGGHERAFAAARGRAGCGHRRGDRDSRPRPVGVAFARAWRSLPRDANHSGEPTRDRTGLVPRALTAPRADASGEHGRAGCGTGAGAGCDRGARRARDTTTCTAVDACASPTSDAEPGADAGRADTDADSNALADPDSHADTIAVVIGDSLAHADPHA